MTVRILQVTDTHVFENPDQQLYRRPVDDNLRRTLDKAAERGPYDLVLLTGDIAEDGLQGTYSRVRKLVEPLADGVLAIPGNHDTPEALYRVFPEKEVQVGNWLILGLNSHWPGHVEGRIAETELQWLRDRLATADTDHVMVAVHHPPHFPCQQGHCGMDSASQVSEVLSEHAVRVVVSGHVHDDYAHQVGRTLYATGPSTCIGFDHDPAGHKASLLPPGAIVYELETEGSVSRHAIYI